MDLLNFLAIASNATGSTPAPAGNGEAAGGGGMVLQLLVFIVPLGLMYLLLIMPQRKKEKKAKELINSAIVGDNIVTIGGVSGKIINIKDDEVTVETGIERSKISFKRWAIKEVVKPVADK